MKENSNFSQISKPNFQQYSLTPKKNDININIKVQQFPPVQYITEVVAPDLGLYGGRGDKRVSNKTAQEGFNYQQLNKTMELMLGNAG
mmetsp:Transcript_31941/g.31203  ORF Transcript_31941/g.31203 Transcript_31941/m.31203 type:complete len:88 (+) Transcript_31941:1062-1325(+)